MKVQDDCDFIRTSIKSARASLGHFKCCNSRIRHFAFLYQLSLYQIKCFQLTVFPADSYPTSLTGPGEAGRTRRARVPAGHPRGQADQ